MPDRWLEELHSSAACGFLGSPLFRSIPLAGLQQRCRQSGPSCYRKITPHSFCPLKLHAWRTNWRLSVQAVSPCLDVMIGVHHCEHSIVHEEFLGIPGDV